ncbi:hypothetical protein ACJJTC_015984 [Scirpophaga incertulas]
MDNKARSSGSQIKSIISTSSTKKKRRQSDDYNSEGSEEYSDEEVSLQGAYEEELSSKSEGSGSGSDLSIFDSRSKLKTISHRPRAGDTPAQPSRSSASKRGFSESDGSPIIQLKRLKPMFSDAPTRVNISSTSSKLAGSDIDRNDASPSAVSVSRSASSTTNLPSDDDDVPLPDLPHNNSPSSQGATSHEVARKECKGCKAQKKRVQTIYECKQCKGSPVFCTKCFCLAHS